MTTPQTPVQTQTPAPAPNTAGPGRPPHQPAARSQPARLLPVILGASLCLLLFKTAGLIFAGGTMVAPPAAAQEKAAPAKPAPDTKPAADAKPPAETKPTMAKPKPGAPEPNSAPPKRLVSTTEAKLLQRLAERRQELAKWASDLDLREKLIKAAEDRVTQRIKELKAINAQIQETVAKRDARKKKQLKNLVSMYENMPPRDAARLFNRLDARVLIDVAEQLNARKMAPILANMDGAAAERLTVALAQRARGKPRKAKPGAVPPVKPGPKS